MSKYKITEIEHPKYPWLHRIQAVSDVNEKVPKGTLGGFIENENNLSQEGTWDIFNNHTKDMFLYENGKWSAFSVPEKLKPPQSYQKRQTKKKNQPER